MSTDLIEKAIDSGVIVSFSSIQYSCVFYFVYFVIDIMFKKKY
jgi:hypothetical protein